VHQSVRDAWLGFNEPLESRIRFMYLDVKGLVSTGVGNLIDATQGELRPPTDAERAASHQMANQLAWMRPDGSAASPDEIAAAWDVVKSNLDRAPNGGATFGDLTTIRLDDAEIDRFVFAKLDQMEAFLKGRSEFQDFETWPADAQLGLLSMAWAMGPAFRFPKFQQFVAAGDWEGAATECRFNPEIGTIVIRNDRNQQLFRNAGQAVQQGIDPSVLQFQAPRLTVRLHSSGPDVQHLQQRLLELGFAVDVTGTFDAATDEAVRSFQSANGLTADGIVGPKTWAAIG
jgi:hypothetical protein